MQYNPLYSNDYLTFSYHLKNLKLGICVRASGISLAVPIHLSFFREGGIILCFYETLQYLFLGSFFYN